jgi:hypothetical protein
VHLLRSKKNCISQQRITPMWNRPSEIGCVNKPSKLVVKWKVVALAFSSFCYVTHRTKGRGSAINTTLDGSTYPGQKLVPSSHCKKFLVVKKWSNLYLGLVTPSSGWSSPIPLIAQTRTVTVFVTSHRLFHGTLCKCRVGQWHLGYLDAPDATDQSCN